MKNKFLIFTVVLTVMLIAFTGCAAKKSYTKDDLFTFEFKIDDISVKIPEKISTFTDAGWEFPEKFKELDSLITDANLKSTYLSKGDNWFSIEIINNSGSDMIVKDCPIGRIKYDFSGDLKIYLANDYLLNDKTLDAVIKAFGEPMSQADYSTYTEIIYDKNEDEGIYDRYTLRFDKETKIINSFYAVYFY